MEPGRSGSPITGTESCRLDFCDRKHYGKGLCGAHYQRYVKGIPLDSPIQTRTSPRERKGLEGQYLCTRCKTYLPKDKFGKGSGVDGVATWCRRCFVVSKYGITRQRYEQMYKEQRGLCATCSEAHEVLVIDHNHQCCPGDAKACGGCVRQLLCKSCNTAIGYLRDNPDTAKAIATYLEKHNGTDL